MQNRLSGPNTGLGWICEGRRRVPLIPRGIAQTMYTEIADKAAEAAAAENKEIQKRLEAERLVAPKSNEVEMTDAEGQTAEGSVNTNDAANENLYPPLATEDQTIKVSFYLSGKLYLYGMYCLVLYVPNVSRYQLNSTVLITRCSLSRLKSA